MAERIAVGIDIGGTGVKAGAVNLDTGDIVSKRLHAETPHPATREAVADTVKKLLKRATLDQHSVYGAGFPAVIKHGVATTASNIDESWMGENVSKVLSEATGKQVAVLNDADAAGIAEVRFGVGRGVPGVIAMVTLGTGIGTALLVEGTLVPNTELGHFKLRGKDADHLASARARDDDQLSWEKWAKNVEEYLNALDRLIWPDLIIIGGGLSGEPEKFLPYIRVRPAVVAATLGNDAGIIGAALFGAEAHRRPTQVRGPYALAGEE
ncbi:MAG: polyphosphate--glucose phosphotransferase [Hyphomicrobiales bacterium]